MCAERFRIFRAEKTYCVNAGKWYFELEVRRNTYVKHIEIQMTMCLVNTNFKTNCDYFHKHLCCPRKYIDIAK